MLKLFETIAYRQKILPYFGTEVVTFVTLQTENGCRILKVSVQPRLKMMRRLTIVGILGISLLVLLGACSSQADSGTGEGASEVILPEGVLFQVLMPDGERVNFTVEQVKAMPQVSIEVDGKTEEGPALLAVLEDAGVSNFSSMTLQGLNLSVTLEKDEITDEVILDITNRDTVKFASPMVPKQDWPKDIMLITVE